jgi:hypothetical protein
MTAMKLNTEDQARLEQLIAAGLRRQPALKAPDALQSRVFAEIARRAALPWYHRSFRGWPVIMQISFVFTALATVVLARSVILWSHPMHAASELAAPMSDSLSFLQSVGSAWSALVSMVGAVGGALLHRVPGFWLVVGLGVAVAMYAMLAGIGVAVFRAVDANKARA